MPIEYNKKEGGSISEKTVALAGTDVLTKSGAIALGKKISTELQAAGIPVLSVAFKRHDAKDLVVQLADNATAAQKSAAKVIIDNNL